MAFNGPLTEIPGINERILEGIASSLSLKALAATFGVSPQAIHQRAKRLPDYNEALESSAILRMEDREDMLMAAATNVDVTRADRLLGHARWLAERSCPDRWGDKRGGTGNVSVQVVIQSPSGNVQCNMSQVIDSVATPLEA